MGATQEKVARATRGATQENDRVLTPREKFVKYGASRTNKTLAAMETLINCSKRPDYEYTRDEADKIVGALRARVDKLARAFENGGPPVTGATFEL